MSSSDITICRVAFCTSTTGVSPVTVIVSSRPPTRMSIGMVSVWLPVSSMLLAHDGVETGQGDRQRIRARLQVHDAVLAAAVGDGGADFFDERRARGLDGHTRQHAAGGVTDRARQRRLGKGGRWEDQDGDERQTLQSGFHRGRFPFSMVGTDGMAAASRPRLPQNPRTRIRNEEEYGQRKLLSNLASSGFRLPKYLSRVRRGGSEDPRPRTTAVSARRAPRQTGTRAPGPLPLGGRQGRKWD